jgi:ABC-type multidrug transport system fused ATPase/permease subunit
MEDHDYSMISDFVYILRQRLASALTLMALGGLIAFLLAFVDPIAIKMLIDEGLGQKNLKLFITVCVVVVLVGIFVRLLRFMEAVWSQQLKNDLVARLCQRMLGVYYRWPYRQVILEGEGYFISRVYDEPRKSVDLVVDLAEQTLIQSITLITALAVSLYLSWRVTAALAVIVPTSYWLSRHFGDRITRESKRENETEASFRQILARGLGAYVTVRLFDLQSRVAKGIMLNLHAVLSALYQRVATTWTFRTFSGLSMTIAESAVLIIAAIDVFLGRMTVGGMLAYMTSFWKLVNGATSLLEQLPDFSRARGYIGRLRNFESDVGVPIPALSSQVVVLRRLSFGYTDQQLFYQLDLTVMPGQPTLLLGPNGCGKTTLGLILSGHLTADCRHEGVSLPIPERVSAMLSPLTFFLGTLRHHLQWDALSADYRALAERILADFKLTDKLDSDPHSLSQGEKRKAYLTMCLLKDADLYIFDEPLMGVADDGKRLVMDWIFRRSEDRMLLVIMHGDLQFHGRFRHVIELSAQGLRPRCNTRWTGISEGLRPNIVAG